jgi:hypothetical protein
MKIYISNIYKKQLNIQRKIILLYPPKFRLSKFLAIES